MRYKVRSGGFTLVELIIVVIVIGILAAIGMPQYTKAIEKARGAEASVGLGNIQTAEKLYFANNEQYYVTAATAMTTAEQSTLDISLPQKGWNFQVESTGAVGGVVTAYKINAIRRAGACLGRTIVQDNKNTEVSNSWQTCVDAL